MALSGSSYDSFHREEEVVGPSNRSFGLVFATVFAAIALLPLWHGGTVRLWAATVAVSFLASALLWPPLLAPANRLWLRLGLVLHRIVNPLVMAALFYLVVTPFAVVVRQFRRDFVRRLRRDPAASSYWVVRDQGASRMDQQF